MVRETAAAKDDKYRVSAPLGPEGAQKCQHSGGHRVGWELLVQQQ